MEEITAYKSKDGKVYFDKKEAEEADKLAILRGEVERVVRDVALYGDEWDEMVEELISQRMSLFKALKAYYE